MCDPISIGAAIAGIAGSLFGSKTPEPKAPAVPAAPAKKSGATVRMGTDENKTEENVTDPIEFTEKRKSARSIGGLGRGGLSL